MTLYFAYGSNMGRAPMAQRCPGAKALGVANLRNHRFVVMANGYASVTRAAGMSVHGVLWRITPRDLAALNAYENVAGGLYRQAWLAVTHEARTMTALVYIGRDQRLGRPRPGYMELVIDAAREWELPEDYVAGLSRWAPGGWAGAAAPDTGDMRSGGGGT